MILISFIDIKTLKIPDFLLFIFFTFFFSFDLLLNRPIIVQSLFSAGISFLLFYFVYRYSKTKGLGFGDVKYVIIIGYVLKLPDCLYAYLTASLTGIFFLVIRRKGKPKCNYKIPFAPFLSFGAIIIMIKIWILS